MFNLLGPLTNPAGALRQLLGVYDQAWVHPIAEVLKKLGSEHVIVVHGHDGMDEISISGPTYISHLRDGEIQDYTISPEDFGLERSPIDAIKVSGAEESFSIIQSVLANEQSAARDIVVLNAGAALCSAGIANSIASGVELAASTISEGKARQKLNDLISLTQSFNP